MRDSIFFALEKKNKKKREGKRRRKNKDGRKSDCERTFFTADLFFPEQSGANSICQGANDAPVRWRRNGEKVVLTDGALRFPSKIGLEQTEQCVL